MATSIHKTVCPTTVRHVQHPGHGRGRPRHRCAGDPSIRSPRDSSATRSAGIRADLLAAPRAPPLRRVGKKGEGRFVTISWDEALAEVADRLGAIARDHGGEAILPFSYGGTLGLVQRKAGHALFHRLGATRLKRNICDTAAEEAWLATYGACVGPTWRRWSGRTSWSSGHQRGPYQRPRDALCDGRTQGRRTPRGDRSLPEPDGESGRHPPHAAAGTDAALALGMPMS